MSDKAVWNSLKSRFEQFTVTLLISNASFYSLALVLEFPDMHGSPWKVLEFPDLYEPYILYTAHLIFLTWKLGNWEKCISWSPRQTCTTSAKEDKIKKSPLDYKWYKETYEYKGQV
jgi:hypothetical protein